MTGAAVSPSSPVMPIFRGTFRAMACDCEIAVDGAMEKTSAIAAMRAAIAEVQRIEHKFSRYRNDEDSIVHRINRAAGQGVFTPCDAETLHLLGVADRLFGVSGGLFDVTSGVLRRAWNFALAEVPSRSLIDDMLKRVGWDKVERREDSISLPLEGMEIDFGGFGKEYAADRAAAVLRAHGVVRGYVNLGGDIAAIGGSPDGSPWQFGVVDPRDKSKSVANISMSDGGLATSGDYERYIEVDGVRYCHIINPKTGMPAQCWRSVSVSHVSTLSAGAITTIAMLKESDAVEFLDTTGAAYLLIDAQGRLVANKAN